jgi:DNA-binding helix-hairpin-helix protein with protein kinase domain
MAMTSLPRLREADLTLGERLGGGAQGDVYRVAGAQGLVFKRFHQAAIRDISLRSLVKWRSSLSTADRTALDAWTAWPQAEVTQDGIKDCGFTMARVPSEFEVRLVKKTRLRELHFLLYPIKPAWAAVGNVSAQSRLEIAQDLARLVAFLHAHELVVGDLSATNVLWRVDKPSKVYLIDTDGCRFRGSKPATEQLDTPDWNDPQAPGGATLDSDRYKLALAVLRIVLADHRVRPDDHPMLPPVVGGALRSTFQRLLAATGTKGSRPTAEDWMGALTTAAFPQPPVVSAPRPQARRPVINVGKGETGPVSSTAAAPADPNPRPSIDVRRPRPRIE